MDVDKSSPLVTTTTAALRKKRYCKLVCIYIHVYTLMLSLNSPVYQVEMLALSCICMGDSNSANLAASVAQW